MLKKFIIALLLFVWAFVCWNGTAAGVGAVEKSRARLIQ